MLNMDRKYFRKPSEIDPYKNEMLNMAPSIYCNQPSEVAGLLEAIKQYINGESSLD